MKIQENLLCPLTTNQHCHDNVSKKKREQEMEFVSIVSDVTAEIDLSSLLKRVMEEATKMLNADRATLFLNDEIVS